MSSYNRIGAVASSANVGVQVQIMRNEWDFNGYNVTDFTGVSLKAAPKESILAGTNAFCGFGVSDITYWSEDALSGDREMLLAIKDDIHYTLYALANSAALNGVNASTHVENVMTWWRVLYIVLIAVFAAGILISVIGYAVSAKKRNVIAKIEEGKNE
jgi:beta-glucosidase